MMDIQDDTLPFADAAVYSVLMRAWRKANRPVECLNSGGHVVSVYGAIPAIKYLREVHMMTTGRRLGLACAKRIWDASE